MPVSTTATTLPWTAAAAERNSTSAEGRQPFSGGCSLSAVTSRPWSGRTEQVLAAGGDIDALRANDLALLGFHDPAGTTRGPDSRQTIA